VYSRKPSMPEHVFISRRVSQGRALLRRLRHHDRAVEPVIVVCIAASGCKSRRSTVLAETRNVRCLAPLSSATARYMQCAVPPSRARSLIPVLAQPIDSGSASALQGLDAIFIPTRDRPANVAALLEQIAWFDGPIYILPSGSRRSRCDRSGRLTVLQPDYDSLDLFRHLRTSRHTQTAHYFGWDLPIKRNHALLYACRKRYQRILLMDDDIRGLTPAVVNRATELLQSYIIAGCFVDDFPDTSVVGHLLRQAGCQVSTFLSGSFLFIRPQEAFNFFPQVYNEDWLFMLPHVVDGNACSFGSISQLPFDLLADPEKAKFQEFGEIIAEGLYEMLARDDLGSRFSVECWTEMIQRRRSVLSHLKEVLGASSELRILIDGAVNTNSRIDPYSCIEFIEDWEADRETWNSRVRAALCL
jgi:hypothetical protein